MTIKINIHRNNNRVFLIDKTGDVVTHAQIKCQLEIRGLKDSLYTINTHVNTDSRFINPFKYHAGCKLLSKSVIPKPRSVSTAITNLIIASRIIFSDLCEAIEYTGETISITLLITLLQDINALKKLSDKNIKNKQLSVSLMESIKNSDAVEYVVKQLYSLKAEPLLSNHCEFDESKGFMMKDKKEVDALEAYSNGFIVYLYSASTQQSGAIVDNLITNCFKSACRKVKTILTDSQKRNIDDFCDVIEEKNSTMDFYTQKPEKINIRDLAL